MSPKAKESQAKKIYLIGIKGTAMSALAIMARQIGYEVTGSDVEEVFPTDVLLKENGVVPLVGFKAENIRQAKPDIVAVSAAYSDQNPEVKAAKSRRCEVLTQSEMLGRLMSDFEGVGVAGVHGKTTTSSLLAYILDKAGFSPSYSIGTAHIPGLSGNSRIGDGRVFVAEADEYRKSEASKEPKFLDLPLKHIIITSIELDHPDLYNSEEDVYSVFYRLASKIPRDGTILACADWPLIRRLISRCVDRSVESYGFNASATYRLVDLKEGKETSFCLKSETSITGPYITKLPGSYNALNCAAAILMAIRLGVSEAKIKTILPTFLGPERRFQYLGELNGAPVYDDFAHHPSALKALLEGVRQRFSDRRIVLVFQPHTYSRTAKLLKEFASALAGADKLVLLNIYASAREKPGYVGIRELIEETRKLKPDMEYRSTLQEATTYLESLVGKDDILLLVGAGDVYKIFSKFTKPPSSS